MDNTDNGGATSRSFGEVAEREDSSDADYSEDTQDESVETDSGESDDSSTNETDDQSTGGEGQTDNPDEAQQPKLTEKGTKLDPNPLSAAHQELANERRIRSQMEQVLASKDLLSKFIKEQYGIDLPTEASAPVETQTPAPTAKKWTGKDFENIEDVADKFNQLQDTLLSEISKRDSQIKKLDEQLGGFAKGEQIQRIANTVEGEMSHLKTLPELDSSKPEFIEGLENEIAALYHKLDFDEVTRMYRGEHSLREIGETLIRAARTAKKAGSQQAQTIVKDKNGGKVRTTTTKTTTSSGDLSPASSIAQGIAKMFGN